MPSDPRIFHITHVDNLLGILQQGGLWCDAQRIARGLVSTNIGHLHIKRRRLGRAVTTRAGGNLGDYVPFNFCPRSVMLYVVNRGHDDYRGGQAEIVHLVSRVSTAIRQGRPWAFTDRHAELAHALHFDDLDQLGQVPWHVMDVQHWPSVREERQAEFLVHGFFPWTAVEAVGVANETTAARVHQVIAAASHQPAVSVEREWYY
ncbi:MAG: DUF4433 domain-containing protein [Nannocystaceae bacterium]